MKDKNKPINDLSEIPENLSDEERMDFLEERGVSEEFLDRVPDAPEDKRPRPRTKPINVRFDDFTLDRLKALAENRNVGYQTLLKTFVQERLYEEEKRGGAFPKQPDRASRERGHRLSIPEEKRPPVPARPTTGRLLPGGKRRTLRAPGVRRGS
jgi:predicted DNA binding CopG/RHH family protein